MEIKDLKTKIPSLRSARSVLRTFLMFIEREIQLHEVVLHFIVRRNDLHFFVHLLFGLCATLFLLHRSFRANSRTQLPHELRLGRRNGELLRAECREDFT